jgi:hypothetical protein
MKEKYIDEIYSYTSENRNISTDFHSYIDD